MGCCQSRAGEPVGPIIEKLPSLVNLESHHKADRPSGLKVHAHGAGWQANAAFGNYLAVHITDEYLFAALFDAHTATEAADFCKKNSVEVFADCLERCNGDGREALKSLFRELDAQFFDSPVAPLTKAACGASGIAAYLDFTKQRCYVANLGTAHCVVGWATGGFNSKSCDGRLLTHEHSARDPIQQQQLKRAFPNDPTIISYIDGKPMLKGVTKLTRCIGYGLGKDSTFAGHYNRVGARKVKPLPKRGRPYLSNETEVAIYDLSPQDEHILLVSEGVLQQLSPLDASLFCSQFSHQNMKMLDRSLSPDAIGQMQESSTANPAAALVRYTIVKAAENWRRKLNRNAHLTIEDMQKLQISGAIPRAPNAMNILRGDIHENVSIIAISLDWPRSRCGNVLAATPITMSKHVAYRWHLVLLFSRFQISRRRTLLKKWWKTVDGAMRRAQEFARQAEIRAWLDEDEVLQLGAASVAASRIPRVSSEMPDASRKSFSRANSGIPSAPTTTNTTPSQKHHSPNISPPRTHYTPDGNVDEGHPESPPSRLPEETLNLMALQVTMRSSSRSTTPTPQTPKRMHAPSSSSRVPFSLVNGS